jgi:tetratricopeptide (TPR) repeat protein
MRSAVLVDYFQQLPALPDGDFLGGRSAELHVHLERFRRRVLNRYTEGTLQRLLMNSCAQVRRAALLALGLHGTMISNVAAAECLHDDDPQVRRLAADALWNIWFRAEGEGPKRELRRLSQSKELEKGLRGIDRLIMRCPDFAEAYNQRAIIHFRLEAFQKSAADCHHALDRNRYHFGAQSGLAQCLLRMKKPRAALRAFRAALKINPDLDGVAESIRELEESLGDGK